MDFNRKLAELFEGPDGDYFKPKEKPHVTTQDERLVESFEEIVKFYRNNGRLPSPDAGQIKERLLSKRLDDFRTNKDKLKVLQPFDELGLLEQEEAPESLEDLFSNDDWLFKNSNGIFDVQKLPNNGKTERATGDIASRKKCEEFDKFEGLFKEKQAGLATGEYKLIKFRGQEHVVLNGFYVSDGLMCYVAEVGKKKMTFGRPKERLRVIFENGTESNMFLRTLSSQLYYGGFEVVDNKPEEETPEVVDENTTGYIYVLKSKSKDEHVATIKNFYKIGQTSGSVEERIKNAESDPTYLMASVEIVQTYRLTGDYNPEKVEHLLHKFFADAKVELTMIDGTGSEYTPDEWYSVPIEAIEQAVDLLNTGEIVDYVYQDGKIIEIGR